MRAGLGGLALGKEQVGLQPPEHDAQLGDELHCAQPIGGHVRLERTEVGDRGECLCRSASIMDEEGSPM